ncbi:MAG TPA: outer membrane lipoprotein carrier protein LolA [Parapedobacter sp.]|uniref:LolA family protein n=1 Tax=Parapedobacter sp. TaxID=1958893 RepID=UPI002BBDC551|nr:outer membrane lipoprotein carrier protein LolA [Parapedobacter sp.]HWK56607.1 outer membrane lipoprotein carrier protein LolA [Parapedobacter sp.]
MNKSIYTVIILVTLVINTVFPGYAQTDAAAKTLLDKVGQTYEAYKTMQAEFSLEIKQAQQAPHTELGKIYMDKSTGKYRITTASQDIISDGKTQWMVLKDVGEVQITDVAPASDAISPTNIFSFYKEGYKYVSSADEHVGGKPLAAVELIPEDTNTPYFKIKLRVDEKTHQIHDVTIFDKGGNRFVYTIKNAKVNPSLASNLFAFRQTDYQDVEIVDLR